MLNILIVEDEPGAARYLSSIIEQSKMDLSICGIAKNGEEALKSIENTRPDIMITDVRMPVMDGIKLVQIMKKLYPAIPVIIVSGYQEFEYARSALSTGVVDYLIKPVKPSRLREILSEIQNSVLKDRQKEWIEFLHSSVCGEAEIVNTLETVKEAETYHIALYREGGLLSRFNPEQVGRSGEIMASGLYKVSGRDKQEWVFFAETERWSQRDFIQIVSNHVRSEEEITSTLLFPYVEVTMRETTKVLQKHFKELEQLIVAGERTEHRGCPNEAVQNGWDPVIADRLDFAIKENRKDVLENAIIEIINIFREKKTTLINAEIVIRSYFQHMVRSTYVEVDLSEMEYELDKVFSVVSSFDQFQRDVLNLSFRFITHSTQPLLFDEMRRWMQEHYTIPLSLESASERFRISASYISKLFRKYTGMSFGEALTMTRIEAAKRLIKSEPEMLMKDVAARVGYSDPFYFSKVFKARTGVSPSEFLRNSSTKC